MHGRTNLKSPSAEDDLAASRQLPDFNATLVDQFTIIQSRIDDAIRSVSCGADGSPTQPANTPNPRSIPPTREKLPTMN